MLHNNLVQFACCARRTAASLRCASAADAKRYAFVNPRSNDLPSNHPYAVFLNAGKINRESERFSSSIAAGRELLFRLDSVVAIRQNFAVETTLSSKRYAGRIPQWKAVGFRVVLHFIQLAFADEAVRMVAARVAAGGDGTPEPDIRRRFQRGRLLFHSTYKALADECFLWSSGEVGMSLEEEFIADD